MSKKIRLYCYICGKTIGKVLYLLTMRADTDRVFICCDDQSCKPQIEKGTHAIKVERE